MKSGKSCSLSECGAWLVSLLFHPVFIPFYTLIIFFQISRYFFYDTGRIIRLLFLSAVVVPLLLLFLLYRLKILRSVFLERWQARAGFTVFMAVIYFLLHRVLEPLPGMDIMGAYFEGIAVALLLAAVFYLFKIKISLHALAVGGTLFFFLQWSYMYRTNILDIVAVIVAIGTVVLVSRLKLQAHTPGELGWGLLTGIAGQWVAFHFLAL